MVADSEQEINQLMEQEEKKLEIIRVAKISNVVALPIENQKDESLQGVLMLYNISHTELQSLSDYLGSI